MKDLTQNSVRVHLLNLAAPLLVTMLTQIAYQLIDLYFITRVGAEATAGVNAAGNAMFLVAALAQVVAVGTTPLIAQAAGRKDRDGANDVLNQSLALSVFLGALTVALLCLFMQRYLGIVTANAATAAAGATFIAWMLPGIALTFPIAALGAGLRGTGSVLPIIVISTLTVILNALLAPVLIAGWGLGTALGVMGAGLATSISTLAGAALYIGYFQGSRRYLKIRLDRMRPRLGAWLRVIGIGVPTSIEFALMFLSTAVVYYTIREFGPSAQAGFGIGSRILQILLLPAMAIGFAVAPIAAQNVGARKVERVRETFRSAALFGTLIMAATTIAVQLSSHALVSIFDADAAAVQVAALFLQLMSWNFVAQGLVYVCANMFQGLGNTLPSLISSAARFLLFSISALWISQQRAFSVEQLWYLLIASVVLQAVLSLVFLNAELRKQLSAAPQ
jgi:putative MATE family efflux protein